MYLAGLRLLSHMENLLAIEDDDKAVELLLCLVSFTDQRDPWTSQEAFAQANLLLDHHIDAVKATPKKFDTLLIRLLQEKIKPVFAKSKSREITKQGQKAISPLPGPFVPSDSEATNKPWKFRDMYIVTVFKWVLERLDVRTKRKI